MLAVLASLPEDSGSVLSMMLSPGDPKPSSNLALGRPPGDAQAKKSFQKLLHLSVGGGSTCHGAP